MQDNQVGSMRSDTEGETMLDKERFSFSGSPDKEV